jgi:hypothetical protein
VRNLLLVIRVDGHVIKEGSRGFEAAVRMVGGEENAVMLALTAARDRKLFNYRLRI